MARLSAFALTVSLLFAVSCSEGPVAPPDATPEPVEVGGVVDAATLDMKVMFEYRGYFGCPQDEAGLSEWLGWFDGPSETQYAGVTYLPDVSDVSASELCSADMGLPDGSTVDLFSNANRQTVDRHFEWMASYGLDGVFLRRAIGDANDGVMAGFRDRVAENVIAGAEAHGRVFAIIYDLGRATPGDIVGDWAHAVDDLRLTSSDRYLHHNGRPVLGVDGSGLAHEPNGPVDLLEAVSSVRAASGRSREAALFVVVPIRWQSQGEEWWADLLQAVDYISPWGVGELWNKNEAAELGDMVMALGASEAKAAGVGYAPVVWPGLSGSGGSPLNAVPRDGGRFYWSQVYEAVSAGADALYVVSFDGMDDGTAMFKLVPGIEGLPVGGSFLSLDVDGYDLPSHWFLRLGGESGRLLRREIPLSTALPVVPTKLPDAARNRVEMTLSTTSDRAAVEISTAGNILTVKLIGTSGEPKEAEASVDGLLLGQERVNAESGHRVSIAVEYTVDEAALRGPLELRLEKGPLGSSELRVVRLTPRGVRVLRQVSHRDTPNLPAGEPMTVVIPRVGE